MIKTIYYKDNTEIINGYMIPYRLIKEKVLNVMCNRIEKGLSITRSRRSYIGEIRVHKILYKLGLFVEKTKDIDLEENIKKYLDIIYKIFGI